MKTFLSQIYVTFPSATWGMPLLRLLSVTVLVSSLVLSGFAESRAEDWARFRGPNGTGVSADKTPLPAEIGPDQNLLWKTELPDGISSPVISGDRVFLTSVDEKFTLETVCLAADSGKILWRQEAPVVHAAKGERLATATPATDGKLVFSFFETSGLLCYDLQGELKWSKWFGPIKNQFNHASSPILLDDKVILVVDHDDVSFIVALDKQTGEEVWRSWRFVFGRNYATPVVWTVDDQQYVVVAGSGLITGYDITSGTPRWYCRATSAVVNPTPVAVPDGPLFLHSSSPSSGAKSSPFSGLLKTYDANSDELLQDSELPPCFLKTFFGRFDSDANQGVNAKEYTLYEEISRPFVTGMVAVKPGGSGDCTKNVIWTESRSMPRTPSAIYQNGVLYVVNEGGVLQSIDPETGKTLQKDRISARGTIYSSPALGDGKIYFGTRNGEISVVSAEADWKNLHSAKLEGEIKASIAISNGRIFIRTEKALYCFGFAREPG